jgi:hypothetical protein
LKAAHDQNKHLERKIDEMDRTKTHMEITIHQLEDKNHHLNDTLKEHHHKMEEAAKIADHRAREEMKKLTEIAHREGEHHVEKVVVESHHGGHHVPTHHGSHHETTHHEVVTVSHHAEHVELSLSYDKSHEAVMHSMLAAMKKTHELDGHRIRELKERIAILEHQCNEDYDREQHMIHEWELAIEAEASMRMDIHKL